MIYFDNRNLGCNHDDTEYFSAQPDSHDEPGNDEGFSCLDCDAWIEVEDEATRLGI